MKMAAKFQEIKTAIGDKMVETKEKIAEIWGQVERFFTDIDLKQMGKDIILGLIAGISSMARSVVDSVGGVVGGAIAGAKKLLGIASPSKVMEEMGEYTGEGFAIGIGNSLNKIAKQTQSMSDIAVNGVGNASTSNASINHSGTIRIEGVNNNNEFIGVVDMVMDQLRREART